MPSRRSENHKDGETAPEGPWSYGSFVLCQRRLLAVQLEGPLSLQSRLSPGQWTGDTAFSLEYGRAGVLIPTDKRRHRGHR